MLNYVQQLNANCECLSFGAEQVVLRVFSEKSRLLQPKTILQLGGCRVRQSLFVGSSL